MKKFQKITFFRLNFRITKKSFLTSLVHKDDDFVGTPSEDFIPDCGTKLPIRLASDMNYTSFEMNFEEQG
jgi:hypothetical protein